jgi:hypothetical protein
MLESTQSLPPRISTLGGTSQNLAPSVNLPESRFWEGIKVLGGRNWILGGGEFVLEGGRWRLGSGGWKIGSGRMKLAD